MRGGQRSTEAANCSKHLAMLQAQQHGSKSAHGHSRNRARERLRDRAEMFVYMSDDVFHNVVVESRFRFQRY